MPSALTAQPPHAIVVVDDKIAALPDRQGHCGVRAGTPHVGLAVPRVYGLKLAYVCVRVCVCVQKKWLWW